MPLLDERSCIKYCHSFCRLTTAYMEVIVQSDLISLEVSMVDNVEKRKAIDEN